MSETSSKVVAVSLSGGVLQDLPLLLAALEVAEVGLPVLVGEPVSAAEEQTQESELDSAADAISVAELLPPLADAPGTLRGLCARLAAPLQEGGHAQPQLTAQPASLHPCSLLLGGAWVQIPAQSLCGVPAVPVARDSLAVLGNGAAFRAQLDRVKPVLTIGKAHSFGQLVQQRMGRQVLERLVSPLVFAALGEQALDVSPAHCIPGLNEAVTRAGSLSGAVLALLTDESWLAKHTPVLPQAGWGALYAALRARLLNYGVGFVSAAAAEFAAAAAVNHITFDVLLAARADALLTQGEPVPERKFRAHWLAEVRDSAELPAGELLAVDADVALSLGPADAGVRRVLAAGCVYPTEQAARDAVPAVQLAAAAQLAQWDLVPQKMASFVSPALQLGETAELLGVASSVAIRLRRELLGLAE